LAPFVIFLLGQAWFTVNGLLPMTFPEGGYWQDYFASTNALREAKGLLWALLLLPMFAQLQADQQRAAPWVVGGMLSGLGVLVLTLLWERHLYTGILNFHTEYRVSGWFFDMHTGGAAVDAALALLFPFVFGVWTTWRKWPVRLLFPPLVIAGLYGLVVTYSRANYPAVIAMALVLGFGMLSLPSSRLIRGRGSVIPWLAAAAFVGFLLPLLFGGVIYERFQTALADAQTRIEHWQGNVTLVNDGAEEWLGAGKGVFVQRYYADRYLNGNELSRINFHVDSDNPYLAFNPSDRFGSMYLRQRFQPEPGQQYRLSIKARPRADKPQRVLVEFCERHILQFAEECDWKGININPSGGEWQEYSTPVQLPDLGQGYWFARSPVDLAILHRGIKQGVDIAAVALFDQQGNNLLSNSDFSDGLDHWFMSDGDHLRWHTKNVLVHLYIEGGWLGLSLFAVLVLTVFARCWRITKRNDPMGTFYAASLAGALAVGMFDSLFDAPRITFLTMLIMGGALLWKAEPLEHHASNLVLPDWIPLPRPWLAFVVALALASAAVLIQDFRKKSLSPEQALIHYGEKLGGEHRNLFEWLDSGQTPSGTPSLQVRDGGYRIWGNIQPSTGYGVCGRKELLFMASCWVVAGEEEEGLAAVRKLSQTELALPRTHGDYGNGWMLAVATDLLRHHPAVNEQIWADWQGRLRRSLRDHLLLLDGTGAAIWHGRTTLAAQAMLLASVLDPGVEDTEALTARAYVHYWRMLNALSVAEAWPEGYNYWVNNRGFIVALSALAYTRAFEAPPHAEELKGVMTRVGLWHVHNTRPDLKATQIGDEGPRIDLKFDTQRVVDLLVEVTGKRELYAYSEALGKRFGRSGYYYTYGWFKPLLRKSGSSSLLTSYAHLPTAEWFGRDAMNMIYMRSDWGEDATFLSFRAGHNLSHHGHYDAGHFTLFKGAPLAVTAATYTNIPAGHRLNHAIRTVSKNSLLVMRPGERVDLGEGRRNVADGGQRLTMPLTSPLHSLEQWREQLDDGLHLRGGDITAFEHQPGAYTFVEADLTAAYNTPQHDEGGQGGKVHRMVRRLLYLRRLDRFLIQDRIHAVDPAYQGAFLLQSMVRPKTGPVMVYRGTEGDGIMAVAGDSLQFRNKRGRLQMQSLLPRQREILLIGGAKHPFWTDQDGDANTLDGRVEGHNSHQWDVFDFARWRVEIRHTEPAYKQQFLTLLSPSLDQFRTPAIAEVLHRSEKALAVRVDDEVVVFAEQGESSMTLSLGREPLRVRVPGYQGKARISGKQAGRGIPEGEPQYLGKVKISFNPET